MLTSNFHSVILLLSSLISLNKRLITATFVSHWWCQTSRPAEIAPTMLKSSRRIDVVWKLIILEALDILIA